MTMTCHSAKRFVSYQMQNRRESSADLVSLRTAHLGMIQGVISRMSGFSATAKNFAVTVGVAIVAISFGKGASALLWAGIAATAVFFLMDAYYHLLEIRFRELYRTTATSLLDPPSDMLLEAPKATAANAWKVCKSMTLLPFYVLLLFALGFALHSAYDAPTDATPVRHVASAPGEESTAPVQRVGGPAEPATKANDERAVRPARVAEERRARKDR